MVTRLGRGHCGAHLTLLFTVEDSSSELESQGSTGAGICLEDGVDAIARGEEGGSSLAVTFQGNKHDSEMYQEVLDELCSEIPEAGELEAVGRYFFAKFSSRSHSRQFGERMVLSSVY